MIVSHLVLFQFFPGAADAAAAAAPTITSESRLYGVAIPTDDPGPVPLPGSRDPYGDEDFQTLARLAELNIYLESVDQWALRARLTDGEEYADLLNDNTVDTPDEELFGREERPHGRVKRRRR